MSRTISSFQGAGHNDVELYNQYLERLKQFVAHELTNWHTCVSASGHVSPSQGTCPEADHVSTRGHSASIDSTVTLSTSSGGEGETKSENTQKMTQPQWF